jgi:hypothetical protein
MRVHVIIGVGAQIRGMARWVAAMGEGIPGCLVPHTRLLVEHSYVGIAQ